MEEWYLLKYLHKMRKVYFITLTVLFLIIGCTPELIIKPDKLVDATQGQTYYEEIKITGGAGPISPASFDYSINPKNSGLEMYLSDADSQFNHLIIKGIPNISKDIVIHIVGETVVRQPFYSPKSFDKTYVIKVKKAD